MVYIFLSIFTKERKNGYQYGEFLD